MIADVNRAYNDEFSYAEGKFLTHHVFADQATSDRTCVFRIPAFCQAEDAADYVLPDVALPDEWTTFPRRQSPLTDSIWRTSIEWTLNLK